MSEAIKDKPAETTEQQKPQTLFQKLSKINVGEHLEQKNGLSYLSWAWAWSYIKDIDPLATREFTKFQEYDWENHQLTGRKVDYCKTDTGTYVECTLVINGHAETETLFVMDYHNKAVLKPTQEQINKTKQRCMVKAAALHGLGLNVYAGEDLPLSSDSAPHQSKKPANNGKITQAQKTNIHTLIKTQSMATGESITDLSKQYLNQANVKTFDELSNDMAGKLIQHLTGVVNTKSGVQK